MLGIKKISVYQSLIALKSPFILSLEKLTHAANVIVSIETGEGITGFGECSPFKTINGESMETARVVAEYLARVIMGKDPLDIEARVNDMDRIIYGNASIKSAFDIALHDIAAQAAGVPLYAFLGATNTKKLQTDYTVSLSDPQAMAAEALKIKEEGFRIIKVKLGGRGEEDVERIRLIREATGMDITLRVDANQGWDFNTAARTLNELKNFDIQFCEEPIPRWDYMRLSALQKLSPIPVMADESVCDHHDAQRLIDLQAVNHFNIKLGKSSGIFKARKILELARKAGIILQVGGFLESRLAFTASAHLALAGSQVKYIDFDTPLMFQEDPVAGGIEYSPGGGITVPDTPGLGAIPKPEYLATLPVVIFE